MSNKVITQKSQAQSFSGEHPLDPHELKRLRQKLISWGQKHFRPFPWRLTEDPYHILIAEVMLHRTQAIQVVPIYEQFIERYPTVPALAKARKHDLQSFLYPLGLRWRIDLIHKMSIDLMKHFNGEVPSERPDLLSLPGVSEYIAGAVRCFAWNLPDPIIDTNTVRVTGRLYGLTIKDSSRRNRRFLGLISTMVDPSAPRNYNYALLDLADQICTKKKPPECGRCPLLTWCSYGNLVVP